MAPPEKKADPLPGNAVWAKIVSTDESGDKVVLFSRDTPTLSGFTETRKEQLAEECSVDFGDAHCLAAFFKQAPGQSIGCGETWVLLAWV